MTDAWPWVVPIGWQPGVATGARVALERGVRSRKPAWIFLLFCALALVRLSAAEPGVAYGASRDEVIKTLGRPSKASKAGPREILTYPQGQVLLENGRVERVDFAGMPAVTRPAPAPEPRTIEPAKTPPADAPASKLPPPPEDVKANLQSTRWMVLSALGVGVAIALVLLWLVWRNWGRAVPVMREKTIAERIAEAASGLPTQAEIVAWPKERLRVVVARLAETQGYVAALQPASADKDIVLRHVDEAKPRVFVCCAPGNAGVVSAKRLREFVGTLVVEGVLEGWFVSPHGFAVDARIYAEERTLLLVDAETLLNQLRDLPPLMLSRVLASGPQL